MVMEVLSGLLRRATEDPRFSFHPRCQKVRLSHLCFADDLLIFSAGSKDSVDCLKDTLVDFGAQSGLQINTQKTEIYFTAMSEEEEREILHDTGFTRGDLPVRYLGIPLITKRLTSEDCSPLVDAIASRIKHWTSRHLSYAGRLQLVKSVLFAIQTYWSSVFPIPKTVCYKLEQLMSRFLWAGPSLDPHKTKVAWKSVCKLMKEGGLGLKRVTEWNRAALLKHIWHLLVDPDEALWARWARTYLLRGESFWYVDVPDKCSWVWRRLLTLRYLVRSLISWRMGDGSRISFWFDAWTPVGPLWELFDDSLRKSSRISSAATVREVFSGDDWCRFTHGSFKRIHRHTRTFYYRLQELITPSALPVSGSCDRLVWSICADGQFTVASAWRHFSPHFPTVPWADFVWSKGMLPRFSFVLWLVMQGRLYTSDFLFRVGATDSSSCAICGCRRETIDHLFFLCPYSEEVWRHTLGRLVSTRFPRSWHAISSLLFSQAGGFLRRHATFGRLLGACIYYIWMERNKRRIGERYLPPRILASIIVMAVPIT